MTLNEIAIQTDSIITVTKANFLLLVKLLALLWLINIINWVLFRSRLNIFGIYPRKIWSIPGIWISPILHADANHLFFNSIPLLILADLMLLSGLDSFILTTLYIVTLAGILLWIFGRPAIHIGASNLIMGYFGYLLSAAFYRPSAMAIILAIVSLYYFGGLILGLFPTKERISWEGHLFGFISGIAVAFYFLS